jgi:hypothetical protein
VRRYSDALLMFLLRAHQPAVYREPRAGSADGEARRAAAEKWALRTAAEQDRLVADAVGYGEANAIDRLLREIDGGTRTNRPGDGRAAGVGLDCFGAIRLAMTGRGTGPTACAALAPLVPPRAGAPPRLDWTATTTAIPGGPPP